MAPGPAAQAAGAGLEPPALHLPQWPDAVMSTAPLQGSRAAPGETSLASGMSFQILKSIFPVKQSEVTLQNAPDVPGHHGSKHKDPRWRTDAQDQVSTLQRQKDLHGHASYIPQRPRGSLQTPTNPPQQGLQGCFWTCFRCLGFWGAYASRPSPSHLV